MPVLVSAATRAFQVVPLLREIGGDPANVAGLVHQRLVASRAVEFGRFIRRVRGELPLEGSRLHRANGFSLAARGGVLTCRTTRPCLSWRVRLGAAVLPEDPGDLDDVLGAARLDEHAVRAGLDRARD